MRLRQLGKVEPKQRDDGRHDSVVEPQQAQRDVRAKVPPDGLVAALHLLDNHCLGLGRLGLGLFALRLALRRRDGERLGRRRRRLLHQRDENLRVGEDGLEVFPQSLSEVRPSSSSGDLFEFARALREDLEDLARLLERGEDEDGGEKRDEGVLVVEGL